jgi:hypothetical protein
VSLRGARVMKAHRAWRLARRPFPWLRYLVALFVVAAMGQGVVRGCNEGGFEFERQVAAGGSQ